MREIGSTKAAAGAVAFVALLAAAAPAQAPAGTLAIELNRLAPADGGCELALVLANGTDIAHEELRAELVLFTGDRLIGRRVAADLGPVDPGRTVVRAFLVPDTDCGGVGRILINDFTACADAAKTGSGRCRPEAAVTSRIAAELVY